MKNNIKNFIEEGENKFEEKFIPEYVKMYGNDIDIEKLAIPMTIGDVKQFISSRQISLIKMIVEICKENAEDMVLDSGADLKLIKLDTITSKLKDLIKE